MHGVSPPRGSVSDEWIAVLGAGFSQRPLIDAAKSLRYRVVCFDQAAVSDAADLSVPISTEDSPGVLRALKASGVSTTLKAVVSRASGPALLTDSRIAAAFNLGGFSPILVQCALSRGALHEFGARLSVPVMKWTEELVGNDRVIIKPDCPRVGKQGHQILQFSDSWTDALHVARSQSLNGRAVVESFFEGETIGLGVLLCHGKILQKFWYREIETELDGLMSALGLSDAQEQFAESFQGSQMSNYAERFLSISPVSGFAFFSFRVSPRGVALMEINLGLGGDGLAETILPRALKPLSPFELDVLARTGRLADRDLSSLRTELET